MNSRSAEEQAIRGRFGAAHKNFWQSTSRALSIEKLIEADFNEDRTGVLEAWRMLLSGHGGAPVEFSDKQILWYLSELHELREQYPDTFYENLFLNQGGENVFSRLFGAIMPYVKVNQPLAIPAGLSIDYLMMRGAYFAFDVNISRARIKAGLYAEGAKFRNGLILDGGQIGGAGLRLNSVRETELLRIRAARIDYMDIGSSEITEIDIDDTLIKGCAECRSMTTNVFSVTRTMFESGARFQKSTFNGRTSISAKFGRFPEFYDSKLSEESRIEEIDFQPRRIRGPSSKEAERVLFEGDLLAIRHLRIQAQQKRWLREEVKFFAEEQRVERRLLRHPSRTTEFVISWFYDKASAYGSSVSTATRSFLLFNLAACVFYELLLFLATVALPSPFTNNYVGLLPGAIQVENSSFSGFRGALLGIQNVFNPLALFTAKSLVTVHSPWVLFASLIQTIVSLALLALLILAIKTRFQRSSGGGSM